TSAERNERKRRENEAIGNQRANVRREEGRRKDQQAKEKVQKELERKRLARKEALKPKPFAEFSQGSADFNEGIKSFTPEARQQEVEQLAAEKTKELESRRASQQANELKIAKEAASLRPDGKIDINDLSGQNLANFTNDILDKGQEQRQQLGLRTTLTEKQFSGLKQKGSGLISGGKNIFGGAKALGGVASKAGGIASRVGGLFTQPKSQAPPSGSKGAIDGNAPASIPTNLPKTLGLPPRQGPDQVNSLYIPGSSQGPDQVNSLFIPGSSQGPDQVNSLFTPGSSQGPATNLQQQENLRNRQARIRRTQGDGAAARFGQTFGLGRKSNSGPGQGRGQGTGQGGNPAQDFAAFSDSVVKLQETTKSLTEFATQLNTAADKLAQLQTIQVSLNATVAPIEVILNGASIINEFGDTAKKEIYNQLVTKLEDEFVKKTTDGSISEPTLG
ncbi:MAG: hypothetical protein HWN81_04395, partial [Candidatus Lokiarchaeota archaeon]|nr:hypothetical protein [Candidatus Lokiarchaeota archaeon]